MTPRKTLSIRHLLITTCLLSMVIIVIQYTQLYSTIVFKYIRVNHEGINASIEEEVRTKNNKDANFFSTITILAYSRNRWFIEWISGKLDTSAVFQSCPLSKNCILTTNRSLINKVDAVIFNWTTVWREKKKLQKRKLGQVWIFMEMEAPDLYRVHKRTVKFKHINWTVNYRRDADFTLPYGKFVPHDTGYKFREQYGLLRSKSKTAVGFISHCNATSKRDEFIRKLRSYGVDIDIYGGCGNLKCGGNRRTKWMHVWNVTQTHPDPCLTVLNTKYKFYLSFENALCEDYVTEKALHHVISKQIVPVIRSGANRSLFHPPESFLNTKDFKSIKSLAKRITFLSENFDEYLKYFDWRRRYTVETLTNSLQSAFCDICYRLHHQDRYKRLYRNFNNFLSKSHDTHSDGICKEANDLK